ncbi:MAG: ParA family protein, partial [bacterium]
GGVGKSTLARAVATVAAAGGVNVLLADLDPQQATVLRWEKTRSEQILATPLPAVKGFTTAAQALAAGTGYELLVIDGPARASRGTLEIAEHAHLVVVPCGASVDDLHPTVLLLHEFLQQGIEKGRVVVALSRISGESEEARARAYIKKAGYEVIPGCIHEKTGYRDALDRGLALNEAPHRALKKEADALVESLLNRVMTQVKTMARTEKRA